MNSVEHERINFEEKLHYFFPPQRWQETIQHIATCAYRDYEVEFFRNAEQLSGILILIKIFLSFSIFQAEPSSDCAMKTQREKIHYNHR